MVCCGSSRTGENFQKTLQLNSLLSGNIPLFPFKSFSAVNFSIDLLLNQYDFVQNIPMK